MRTPKKPLGPFLMAARSIAHEPLYVSGYNMETKTQSTLKFFQRIQLFSHYADLYSGGHFCLISSVNFILFML